MKLSCAVSLLVLCVGCAESVELSQEAHQAALASLQMIDDKAYGESWEHASSIFRGAVTKEDWLATVTKLREPQGLFQQRMQRSAVAKTNPASSPKGDYILVTYDAQFSESIAIETLVMYLDDGQWQMAGYFLKEI